MLIWVVVLFLGGIALLLAEFLLPGGICGITGAVLIISSTILGVREFPDHAVIVIMIEFAGAVVAFVLGMVLMAHPKTGRALKLDLSQQAEAGYTNQASDLSLVGKTGTVLTALRPAGTILVDGQRIDAVSAGTFIDKGQPVRVTEVYGNRIVVEALEAKAEA